MPFHPDEDEIIRNGTTKAERNLDRSSFGEFVINYRFGCRVLEEASREVEETLCDIFGTMAAVLDRVLPDGHAKTLTMTNLEQTLLWARAAAAELSPPRAR
jgi:hypothetical protein